MDPKLDLTVQQIPVSVVIITKNEGEHLAKTLKALDGFQEVVVVDSESVDATREIAKEYGARIFERRFDDFASQKNYGVQQALGPWILSLDADEIPDSRLIGSIRDCMVRNTGAEYSAYAMHRRNIHFGRELRWAGQGQDFPVRLFLKDRAEFVNVIHEVVKVRGKTGRLEGNFWHESNRSVAEYVEKLSRYTALEARVAKGRGGKVSFFRWGIRPVGKFIYDYVIRLGFLDGFEGFLFHVLSAFYVVICQIRMGEEVR